MNTELKPTDSSHAPLSSEPSSASHTQGQAPADDTGAFGRVRWWFEESPIAFTTSVAIALLAIGLGYILTVRVLRADAPLVSVSLQAVLAESLASDSAPSTDEQMDISQLTAASAEVNEMKEEKFELPELPKAPEAIKPLELVGNQAESDKSFEETQAALREANEALRKILERNVNPGPDTRGGGTGQGVGQLDPNSTPGRMARWVISYPTVPQSEYERMLDFFRIDLAYLKSDRRTMQYLSNMAGAGTKTTGAADQEDRMFWYWMGQNRLRELDDSILRKHGLEPTSDVVHLYAKELERRLADMEREYLKRHFKTGDVDRIAQTNYRISNTGATWRLEVTSIVLR